MEDPALANFQSLDREARTIMEELAQKEEFLIKLKGLYVEEERRRPDPYHICSLEECRNAALCSLIGELERVLEPLKRRIGNLNGLRVQLVYSELKKEFQYMFE